MIVRGDPLAFDAVTVRRATSFRPKAEATAAWVRTRGPHEEKPGLYLASRDQ